MWTDSLPWMLALIAWRIALVGVYGAGLSYSRRNDRFASAAPLLKILIAENVLAVLCMALLLAVGSLPSWAVVTSFARLLLADCDFLGWCVFALLPLAVYMPAAYAVLKRNFVSYFSTPTGYVFLCVFVFLTSIAAFWPHEFFTSNMATLHQLTAWAPFIMLIFIPAITMSVWAEERRQGTDELLLTMPADDLDVVLGKYLAAAAIFTCSLLFSQLSNYAVLNPLALGGADVGLFFTTYLGYWMIGLAMVSIGMVASFLTRNLTVGFILGALFNVPLVALAKADTAVGQANLAQSLSRWSLSLQAEDFSRGVISIASVCYFLMIVVGGIYVSVVLIGRRHWWGGRDGHSMIGHYALRVLAIIGLTAAVSLFFTNNDFIRYDTTSEKISSLSPDTRKLLKELDLDRPVYVEAYISQTLPEEFVNIKFDLISLLEEIRSRAGDNVKISIHDNMEPFSVEAKQAEDRYGIRPTVLRTRSQGVYSEEEVFLAAVFTCGLERVIVPFFGQGASVEYELVRSLVTVAAEAGPSKKGEGEKVAKASGNTASAKEKGAAADKDGDTKDEKDESGARADRRRVVGVLRTDAQMNGTDPNDFMAMMQGRSQPQQAILAELGKQYTVEDVDPNAPIDVARYDVMLAVQPSSLTDPQLDNLIKAISDGLPTAIFEDPAPLVIGSAPGTDQPKPPMGGMMGQMQPPPPKGDIKKLWNLLGVRLARARLGTMSPPSDSQPKWQINWRPFTSIVWQNYNPYPRVREFPDTVVFANPNAAGAENTFNSEQPAVSGMNEVAFIAPGALQELRAADKSSTAKSLRVIPLVRLGTDTGVMPADPHSAGEDVLIEELDPGDRDDFETEDATRERLELRAEQQRLETGVEYLLAARISSRPPEKKKETKDKKKADSSADQATAKKIDVVLVSDIDILDRMWIAMRDSPPGEIDFQFQNVAFALNLVDALAGDERFLDIRKRTVHHAPLKLIENRIREAEDNAQLEIERFEKSINEQREQAAKKREKMVQSIEKDLREAEKELQELIKRREGIDSTVISEAESAERQARQKLQWRRTRNEEDQRKQEEAQKNELAGKLRQIQRDLDLDRRNIQNQFKVWAVALPPIPPILVALGVLVWRLNREREGVSRSRMR